MRLPHALEMSESLRELSMILTFGNTFFTCFERSASNAMVSMALRSSDDNFDTIGWRVSDMAVHFAGVSVCCFHNFVLLSY